MSSPATTSDSKSDDLHRIPGWLLLCVWVMILAICLLQLSLAERTEEWRMIFVDWGPWLLVAPLVIWLSSRWPIEQRTWRWTVPAHILLSLVVTASLATLTWHFIGQRFANRMFRDGNVPRVMSLPPPEAGMPPPPDQPGGQAENPPQFGPAVELRREHRMFAPRRAPFFLIAFTRGRGSVFFYWALLAMTHAVTYHRRSVIRERRALLAEARLTEAKLTALQAQLQPHFLFNTLNTISALVYSKPAAADEMICSLSDLLRRVLAASARREVKLSEEISMARSYLAIQQVRFADFLTIIWDVPDDLSSAAVPTLLLQPLVENAVVHAVERMENPCTITIRVSRKDARLLVDVTNTAATTPRPRDAEKGLGIGLTNTQARLTELYGADQVFNFALDPNGSATVHIELPYRVLTTEDENPDRR